MKRHLRSIRQQLQFIVVSTTLVAVAVAVVANALINILAFRNLQASDLWTQADLLGRMTSPALMFDDPALAQQNLASLEIRKQIQAVAIYRADGKIFATFHSPGRVDSFPDKPGPAGTYRESGSLIMIKPIQREGAFLGTIYLRADEGLAGLAWRQIVVAAGVGLLALVIALALVRRLGRSVTRPITQLATAARDVVAQGDYSRRVVAGSEDELGDMIGAFNAMLAEVEQGQAELEARVRARTAELEESNRELEITKLRAEEANVAKSSFLASMSHEIRTPMNGVIGMVDVLHQTSLTGQQVEMVELVRESAFSLLTVIDDILDFSKIEADRLEVELAPIHLAEVIEKACGLMDSLAIRHDVEFLVFVDPTLPDQLLGDALRLRQILVNLINNAIKFSGGREFVGKVSVRATLIGESSDGVDFCIEVQDNGIGMDAETLSRLFTAFSQADTSTTRRFGGTGLGLVISRRLVELMGGRISVTSELGLGSNFRVDLRLAPAPGLVDQPPATSPLANLRCMAIGPDAGIADDVLRYLRHSGAQAIRATNLDAALGLARDQIPGDWVWVIDGGVSPPGIASLRALVRELDGQRIRFVVLGRGPRREPHLPQADFVELDGNVLTQRRLTRAVALATGLAPEDTERFLPGQSRSTNKAPSREQARRDGRLILVAEDNETNQKVIVRQLSLLGYAADVAANGAIALERWRSGDYALLLTDLHMPKMDGYELTAAIRADKGRGASAPIIALSANALKGETDRCRGAGMNDYLSKPLQLENLKSTLQAWLPDASAAPAVDIRVLERLVGDEADIVRGVLDDFRRSANRIAAAIRKACEDNDTEQAGAQGHKLKSAARTIGASRLGDICEQLEGIGQGLAVGTLADVWPAFESEMQAVNTYLDQSPGVASEN